MSMEHHSSNQVENNPLFELSSESLNKLDEVLNSDSVKQLLSDSKSLENLAAAILDNEAPTTSAHASASNINVGHSAPGHVATVQEGMDLVDALDSLVNQLTNQNQMAHPSNSTVNQPYARDNGPDVDYLGGNLEIGSSFDENWVDSVFLDHTYSCVPVKQQGPPLRKDSGSDFSGSSPNTPQRRSLRQIEKIEKSVLEKIKAENQEMLKREREEMGVTKEVTKPKSGVDESCLLQVDQEDDEDEEADDSLVIDVDEMGKPVAKKKRVKKRQISTDGKVAPPQIQRKHSDELENVIAALSGENSDKKEEKKTSGRSQRQRRKPKRWDDDEVEVDFSGTASELGLSAINTPSSVKRSLTKEFKKDIPEDSNLSEKGLSATEVSANNNSKRKSEDSDGEENSEEWASDDDPDKLWCICRQPHNNRFMICCDGCEDWFHGTCVGVTKKQGRICEQEKRKWFCAKCRGEDPKKLLENKGIESVTENSPEKTPAKKPKIEEKKDDGLKKIRKTDDNKKKDQLDIKLKQKPRVLKTSANADKKEEEKLKKLIKSTKMEFKKKFRKEKDDKDKVQEKEKRKEPPSEPISKVVPIVKKPEDKKKKLKEQPIDLSFQDLFKAEPMMTKKSLNSPLAIPSPNTPTTPKITNMQSPFRKPSISGDTPSGNQPRKIAPLPCDLTCISCSKIFSSKPGKVTVYCSEVCIEKHVKDMLEVLKQTRSSPGPTKGEKRVVVFEKSSGRTMAGANAIAEDKILEYLKAHPSFEILKPNLIARRQSSESEGKKRDVPKSPTKKKEEPKKEEKKKDDFAVKQKPKSAQSPTDLNAGGDSRRESGPDSIRHNVRKALRETLTARYQEASEMRSVTQDDIKKIASRIEEEMYNYFNKDTSSKYRTRYRSLIFNLKDIKNEGLFRKVLTGKIEPSRLVRMSPEELASAELAKWREMENKHMLEMIKRDAEQQAQQVIVKKTHKGEELIETKPKKAIEEEGSGDNCMENKEGTLMVNTTFDDLLQEDTTSKHGEHVFDVRCKLCRNSDKKNAKNKDEPKRVRVELDEPTNKILQEAAKLSKDVKSGISSSRDLDPDQIPTSTTVGSSPEALPNQNKSCWKGIIFMQDVAKFVASGHKVSGTIESQDIPDFVQVCGRIAPEQVLDYVKKLKFSSRTEISVVRFSPTTHEEKTDYNAFFTYLNDRKRYGVVGASKSLKDFYILPLPQDVDPPEVLLPFSGPGLGKRHHRQNLLLGILIKSKKITEKHVSSKHTKEKQGQKTGIAENAPVPQERSYTPPPPVNCNNDTGVTEQEPYDPALSLTPPPKTQYTSSTPPLQEDITSSKDEEPYDPEDGSPVNTDNLGDLLEQISKSTNPTEMTSALLSKIANSATIEQQKRLLNELTNKVEESKKQLEEQRRAAEAAFSIATSSAANREKGSIPGLDGSFPTEEKSLQLPGNIKIPDNLKEILETVQRKTQEQEKSKVFDDPIVKTYGDENIEDPDEEEATKEETESKNSEPMELDEDSVKDDTILEVNNTKQSMDPRLRSKKQQPLGQDDKRVSQLRDDELMYKAQLQLKALKDMEMRQKNLEEAQKQAADAINKAASSHLSTASTSSVVIPSVTTSSSSTTPPDEAKPKIQIQWKKKPLITKT